jgi:hypothetical protein
VQDGDDLGAGAAKPIVDAIRRDEAAADLFTEKASEFAVRCAEVWVGEDTLKGFFERFAGPSGICPK